MALNRQQALQLLKEGKELEEYHGSRSVSYSIVIKKDDKHSVTEKVNKAAAQKLISDKAVQRSHSDFSGWTKHYYKLKQDVSQSN